VFAQDVLKSRASHGLASSGQEHFRAARLASQGKPGAERHPDFLPEQQGALLAAFAVDADLEQSPVESNVLEPEPDQLRGAQPTCERQIDHCAIPNAILRVAARLFEDGVRLRRRKMPYKAQVDSMSRDGDDPSDLVERRRHLRLDEAHEGLDRREPSVARARPISTCALDLIEERQDQRSVELLKPYERGRDTKPLARELEQ